MSVLSPSRGFSDAACYVDEQTSKSAKRLQESALGSESVRLEELASVWEECRLPNWDGYDAFPVDRDTLDSARGFLEAFPVFFPQPTIAAEPDGQITFEWYRSPRRLLSVSVSPDGELHYAALLGAAHTSGTEPFFGEIPESILNLIRQIRPC